MAKKIDNETNTIPVPEVTEQKKPVPEVTDKIVEIPMTGNPEDYVEINGMKKLIKPTKLKYQRDKTASFYRIVEAYPLADILQVDKGIFDEERDGDKCLFDWLISVFDDAEFVKNNYDDIDTKAVNDAVKITKRLNGITEKEEQLKNRQTKETRA